MPTKTKPTQPAAERPIHRELSMTIGDPLENPTEHFALTVEQYSALKDYLAKLQAPPLTHDQQYQARQQAAKERAGVIANLLGNLDGHRLEMLETVVLMSARTFCGIDDPISKFICDLIWNYAQAEADCRGLSLEVVENELAQLRENFEEALTEAAFIASRYPIEPEEKQSA